jgi:uncharacterized protein (TIGR02646 family)
MRPVRRNASPQAVDFEPYSAAKYGLIARLGSYCSYCERRVEVNLAVEHIQPKGLPAYAGLIGRWENFLLACVNCNSAKRDQDVVLAQVLLPDRDNTFVAFAYSKDGKVGPAPGLPAHLAGIAVATLTLLGLDKRLNVALDENGEQIVVDRVSKRMEVWGHALVSKDLLAATPQNEGLRATIATLAAATGLFSIWMAAFSHDQDMLGRIVAAYPGTGLSGCFDPTTFAVISPHPNADGLASGGKI